MVLATTYLTLVVGELVPKQLALRQPEVVAARIARALGCAEPGQMGPFVWALGLSTALVLRLFGAGRPAPQTVTEEELKALLAEGAQAGVLEAGERDMIERLLRLADKPVRAIMTPRNEIAFIDRSDPRRDIVHGAEGRPAQPLRGVRRLDRQRGRRGAGQGHAGPLLGGGDLSVAAALRQPMVVPDTISALDALERLKATRWAWPW